MLELIKYNPEELIKSFILIDFINPIKLILVSFNEEEIQFIPIKINGNLIIDSYYLAVTKKGVDCVDESKSLFDKWKEDDSVRPDKAGEYKTIYKLMIDPEKIQGAHFFRIKKYDVAIIISEKLKHKMEEKHIKGIKFKKVSL